MDIAIAGVERRPLIKVRADGKPYVLVHTRGGMRTRQFTDAGWAWVRARYPADAYPSPADAPLTYDEYRAMWQDGFVRTHEAPPPPPSTTPTTTKTPPRTAVPGPTGTSARRSRPWRQHPVRALEQVFLQSRSDRTVLRQLKGELRHRKTQRARLLLASVEAALPAAAPQPPAPRCPTCVSSSPEWGLFCPTCGRPRPAHADASHAVRPPPDRPAASAAAAPPSQVAPPAPVAPPVPPTSFPQALMLVAFVVFVIWLASRILGHG